MLENRISNRESLAIENMCSYIDDDVCKFCGIIWRTIADNAE